MKFFTSPDYQIELRLLAGRSLINYTGYPLDYLNDTKIQLNEDYLDLILSMLDNDLNYGLVELIPSILSNYMIIST